MTGPAAWIGAASLAAALIAVTVGTHLEPQIGWPMAWTGYALAFVAYGGLLWAWRAGKIAISWRAALLGALVLRVILLPSEPFFSDDIWRYLWDGHVQAAGVNPYQFAPADPALSSLHTDIWPKINHPEVPTIYPPVAQIVFVIGEWLGGTVLGMRLIMIAAEAAALWGVFRLTRPKEEEPPHARDARRAALAVVVAWNPLMIVEFAGSGHLDILAIAPLVWALAVVAPRAVSEEGGDRVPLSLRAWAISGACVGLSAGAKLLGVLLLPALLLWAWWPARWPNKAPKVPGGLARCTVLLAGAAVAASVTATPYVTPLVFDSGGTFGEGLSTYARKWRANDGAFALIAAGQEAMLELAPGADEGRDRPWWRFDALGGVFTAMGITQEWEGKTVPSTTFTRGELELSLAKLWVALLLGVLLLFLLHQRYDPSTVAMAILAALLLLAPTVHPWYITWLVPLAAVHRSKGLLLWSAMVVLGYEAAMRQAVTGVWEESVIVRVVEYLPVFFVLSLEVGRRLSGQKPKALGQSPTE